MPRYFNIVRLALTTTDWTDVVVPEDCSRVRILNEDDAYALYLRSNKGDSSTEMTILPSATYPIDAGSPECPFQHGTVVCSLRAQTGGGPAVAQFIR